MCFQWVCLTHKASQHTSMSHKHITQKYISMCFQGVCHKIISPKVSQHVLPVGVSPSPCKQNGMSGTSIGSLSHTAPHPWTRPAHSVKQSATQCHSSHAFHTHRLLTTSVGMFECLSSRAAKTNNQTAPLLY